MPNPSKRFSKLALEVRQLTRNIVDGVDSKGRKTLVIPAKHKEVGDLTIFDDETEITIQVGKLFHKHFVDYYTPTAIEFLRQLLNDDLLLYIVYDDKGNVTGGGSCAKTQEDIKAYRDYWPRVCFWSWSGPYAVE